MTDFIGTLIIYLIVRKLIRTIQNRRALDEPELLPRNFSSPGMTTIQICPLRHGLTTSTWKSMPWNNGMISLAKIE